ncbi:MAG: hypothetical protein IJB70_10435 [Clostridia bacterium]|nr:hypothetical protein [Clostridia bacterium]
MYICDNCKNTYEEKFNFCPNCGEKLSEVVEEVSEPVVPVDNAEAFAAPEPLPEKTEVPVSSTPAATFVETFESCSDASPVYHPQVTSHIIPASSAAPATGKATAIVGMVFGILGLILSGYHLLYVAAFLSTVSYAYEAVPIAISMLVVAAFMLPVTIVGIVMSSKPVSRLRGMALAGKITAFISLGVFALSLFLNVMLFFV